MNSGIPHTHKAPFGVYISTTFILFILTLSAADSVGFVPDSFDGTERAPVASETSGALAIADLPELGEEIIETPAPVASVPVSTPAPAEANFSAKPTRIIIPAIDMNLPVQNPTTRDLTALDTLLQKGPARYVDSAEIGARGNVIVFAHSSNLPVVHNKMYKAFNRVQELTAGDTITMQGDDGMKYLYSVVSMRKANANDETIDLSPTIGAKLTLVTCDTLTSKSSRFIVEADYIGQI